MELNREPPNFRKALDAEVNWRPFAEEMNVVRLNWGVRLLVPSLLLSSIPARTRGMTFHTGRWGLPVGGALAGVAVWMGILLIPDLGYAPMFLLFWLFGTAGVAMAVTAVRPVAFIKPLCVSCRLLPIIKEHEAIHLAGVAGEKEVWQSMKSRHSVESLALEGDPAICSFCPIPKRLKEN